MNTACSGRKASRVSIVEVIKIQPRRCRAHSERLSCASQSSCSGSNCNVSPRSENTPKTRASCPCEFRNGVRVLGSINDHVNGFRASQPSDHLRRRWFKLKHPSEDGPRRFQKESRSRGLVRIGFPRQKTFASSFLSVGTRISPAGDQYGDLVSSGLRMMSPRFGL